MKRSILAKHIIIAAVLLLPFCVAAQQPILLQPGAAAVNFTIKKEEKRSFTFSLKQKRSYNILVEQKGIDVVLTLKDAQGNIIRSHDSTNGAYGPELITYQPTKTGNYILEIAPLNQAANSAEGKCVIRVQQTATFDKHTHIVTILNPAQLSADLKVFKQVRIAANSGLYRYRTKAQLDSIYKWADSRITKPLSILDFYKIIVTLSDFEGSCHNWTGLPYDIKYYLFSGKGYFPFYMKYIDGKMITNNDDAVVPLGSRILSINGHSDKDIINVLSKYRTTDGYNTTQKLSASVSIRFGQKYQLEFGTADDFLIRYSIPNSTTVISKAIKSISLEEQEKRYGLRNSAKYDSTLDSDVQPLYSFKQIDAATAQLDIRTFTMADQVGDDDFKAYSNKMDSIFKTINANGTKNLIVDVRNNPGGSGDALMKAFTYLANTPFKENTTAYINFNKVPLPQYFKWGSADKDNQLREQLEDETRLTKDFSINSGGKYFQDPALDPAWQPDSNRFKGKIYLLINENVASAASHFASLVKAYSNATIIGVETTGGYYGHNGHIPVTYELPNSKIQTRFSIVFVEQDAPQKTDQPFGRGIIPNYEVTQSYEDFLANRDTQLQFVLKLTGK